MSGKIYGFPILPKAGLANMLIPWAECHIWCKDNGHKQVAPYWTKLRIGPYIRKERDKRQYHRLFTSAGNISGLRRIFLNFTARKIAFEQFNATEQSEKVSQDTLVCFSDMNHLERLLSRNKEVLAELYRITKPKYWPIQLPPFFIAINIRMGDFPLQSETGRQTYFKQPLHWYMDAVQQLRKSLAIGLPVIIFSDGADQELKPILEIENVIRSPFSESVSDLLAIAKSTILITSRSSFSLVGAFLGQVPTVWYAGKNQICGGYMNDPQMAILEIEWMPGQTMPAEFVNELQKRIQ